MKVLILNSSSRTGKGSITEWMVKHLATGMQEEGAAVETVALRKKRINFCVGCFSCWSKTPGKCIHKDDMSKELLPKFYAADLVVYATPLYYHTLNGLMKTFIERTLPREEPFIIQDDNGNLIHPYRHDPPAAVWLSVAGMPDLAAFDLLSHYVNNVGTHKPLAELYRPAAESLMHPGNESIKESVEQAISQAGREIVSQQAVSPAVLEQLQQPVFDSSESFIGITNLFWRSCIDEGTTPKEFFERGLIPRPDSVQTFLAIFGSGINPEQVKSVTAKLQFKFTGTVEGSCYFAFDSGAIDIQEGVIDEPDLVINSPFELWVDIMMGKADGQKMLAAGQYSVEGNIELLQQLSHFFAR